MEGREKNVKNRVFGFLKIAGLMLLDLAVTNIVVFGIVWAILFWQAFRVGLNNGGIHPGDIERLQGALLSDGDFLLWLNMASSLAVLVVFWFIYLMMNRAKYGEFHMRFREKKGNVLYLLFLAIAIQFVLSILLNLILPLFPGIMNQYTELMDQLQVGQTWLAFLYTVMIAPLAEEITYRGVILRAGEKVFSRPVAVVIQALLFGVMHWNLVQSAYAFLLGLLLGYICIKRDSIWPGVLLHLFTNLSSFLVEPALGVFTNGWQFAALLAGSMVIGLLSLRNIDFDS